MGVVLLYALNAVGPIIIVIGLGIMMRHWGLFDLKSLKVFNSAVFRVMLPTLLFYNIYSVKDLGSINWSCILFAVVILVVLFGLGVLMVTAVPDRKQKGVILQCIFRSNFAIIGLPLATALGGDEGASIAAALSAVTIPLFNVFAVIALSIWSTSESRVDIKKICIGIIKNPLILGGLAGMLALIIRSLIPCNADGTLVFTLKDNLTFVYKAIKNVSEIASPLALIILGGEFEFKAVAALRRQIALGTVWRLVIAPIIGVGLAILTTKLGWFDFGPAELTAFIALFGSPVAVSSAVMAGEMGNDEQLAGQLVVWTSVFSMLSVFVIAVILRSAALI